MCIGRQRMRKYRKVAALLPGHLDTLDRNTRGVLDPLPVVTCTRPEPTTDRNRRNASSPTLIIVCVTPMSTARCSTTLPAGPYSSAGTTTTHPGRHGRHRRNGSQHDRCAFGNGPHVNDGDSCGAQCNRAAIDLVAVCAVVKHRAAPNVERLVRLRGTDQDPLRRVLDPRPRGDPPRLGRLERLVERCRGVRVQVSITGTTRLSG